MFFNTISIIICILIFLMYVYLDYNRFEIQKLIKEPKTESFIIEGHPHHDDFSPIAYRYIANGIKDIETMNDEDEDKNRLIRSLDAKQLIKIASKENDRFYSITKIEDDLKYFNVASHLMDAVSYNSTE